MAGGRLGGAAGAWTLDIGVHAAGRNRRRCASRRTPRPRCAGTCAFIAQVRSSWPEDANSRPGHEHDVGEPSAAPRPACRSRRPAATHSMPDARSRSSRRPFSLKRATPIDRALPGAARLASRARAMGPILPPTPRTIDVARKVFERGDQGRRGGWSSPPRGAPRRGSAPAARGIGSSAVLSLERMLGWGARQVTSRILAVPMSNPQASARRTPAGLGRRRVGASRYRRLFATEPVKTVCPRARAWSPIVQPGQHGRALSVVCGALRPPATYG